MKPKEIRKVIVKYKNLLAEKGYSPNRFPTDEQPAVRHEKLDHCYWMLVEMEKFVDKEPVKAYGWICNIQGVLWSSGFGVVDDYRNDNRPMK